MVQFSSLESALKHFFGYDVFRPGQKQIIEEAINNRDLLVIMPTGGGKSLCFQLPALLKPGLTIVVSPLIALMQDQVDSLQDNGIGATFLNSTLDYATERSRQQAILQGKIKLLYVAPERLLNERFNPFLQQIVSHVGVSAIAIDEAHCVSDWGHDFRPEYRQLRQLRQQYPKIPITALTATATKRVQQDIIGQLRLRQPNVHLASFNRPNISYEVRAKDSNSYYHLLQAIKQQSGAGIVYCLSRRKVEEVALKLKNDGIDALPYHAGLSDRERANNQTSFLRDDVRVIVATIAFGMGINKPDVRFVFHFDLPRSLESFYQESGRAGRDGEAAKSVLFFSFGDLKKIDYLIAQKPDINEQRIAKQQLNQVVDYAEGTTCRRTIVLRYFGEIFSGNCSNCDNCLNPKPTEDWTIEAQKFLSCVARCEQKFGMRQIIDVLRGSRSKKVQQYGHHLLSTHGIGKNKTLDEWKMLGRSLLHQGLLSESNDGYRILKLNKRSWEILRKQKSVTVAINKPANSQVNKAYNPRQAEAEILYDKLKVLRKNIADLQSIAPYVIFADSTLKLMAQLQPKNATEFTKISGVNQHKLQQYGEQFLSIIQEFVRSQELPKPLPSKSQMTTLQLHQQGLNITEIAEQRGYATTTISTHLSELLEMNQPVALNQLVTAEKQKLIIDAIYVHGDLSLKTLREFLGESYSYDELKLVRGWWRSQK
ncbi:DNA helicase RecQ [Hyella patelloides]|uniref:DNA helicase RecQ n=1 Tax=Hyella patelloides TaxID=1982969 RepID=UPI0011A0D3DF|nr:DNA helicase RecQ [Hyella patelloides]